MDLSIIEDFKNRLEAEVCVYAMWVGGSVAEGFNDEYSDIDLWFDVEDDHEQYVLDTIEGILRTKGEIDVNFGEGITPPFTHVVYHLANTNPLHFIEINLHTHSHELGLFDSLRKIKVIFDNVGVTNFKPHDKKAYDEMLAERKVFLHEKLELGYLSVEKEILRGNFPEAMHNYQFWLLEPVVELMRIKYSPHKITFGLKHASRDLPPETLKQLNNLLCVSSIEELTQKTNEIKGLANKYYS